MTSFCRGTQRLYDFIDRNPLVEFHPIEYTNDPYCIGALENVVAINAAVQVDLTGQVNSESLGTRQMSGTGGWSILCVGQRGVGEGARSSPCQVRHWAARCPVSCRSLNRAPPYLSCVPRPTGLSPNTAPGICAG